MKIYTLNSEFDERKEGIVIAEDTTDMLKQLGESVAKEQDAVFMLDESEIRPFAKFFEIVVVVRGKNSQEESSFVFEADETEFEMGKMVWIDR